MLAAHHSFVHIASDAWNAATIFGPARTCGNTDLNRGRYIKYEKLGCLTRMGKKWFLSLDKSRNARWFNMDRGTSCGTSLSPQGLSFGPLCFYWGNEKSYIVKQGYKGARQGFSSPAPRQEYPRPDGVLVDSEVRLSLAIVKGAKQRGGGGKPSYS
jgi:hypothetical protein